MSNPYGAAKYGNAVKSGSLVTGTKSLTNTDAIKGLQWGVLKAEVPALKEDISASMRAIAGGGVGVDSVITRNGIYFNAYDHGEKVAHVSLHSDLHGGGGAKSGPGAFHTKTNNTRAVRAYERAIPLVVRTESNIDGYVQFVPGERAGAFRDGSLADATFSSVNSLLSSGHQYFKAEHKKGGGNCECEEEYTKCYLRFQNIDPKYSSINIDIFDYEKDYYFYTDDNIEENLSISLLNDDAQNKIKNVVHIIKKLVNAVKMSMALPESVLEPVKKVNTLNKKNTSKNRSNLLLSFGGSKKRSKTKKIGK